MEEGKKEKNDENSGHYLITSNRLPNRRPTGTQHACANIPNTFSLPNQEKSENLKKTLKLIHISTSEHLQDCLKTTLLLSIFLPTYLPTTYLPSYSAQACLKPCNIKYSAPNIGIFEYLNIFVLH